MAADQQLLLVMQRFCKVLQQILPESGLTDCDRVQAFYEAAACGSWVETVLQAGHAEFCLLGAFEKYLAGWACRGGTDTEQVKLNGRPYCFAVAAAHSARRAFLT